MRLLNLAADIAVGGNIDRTYFVGCVIKRKDGAVVRAINEKVKTPTPSAHAESRALRKSDWGCTLYVARVTRDGHWAMSRPCSHCQAIIINRGVNKVYYTIAPGEYGVWHPKVGRCMKKKYVYHNGNKIGYVAKAPNGDAEAYTFVDDRPVLMDSFTGSDAIKFAEELIYLNYFKK